MTKDTNLKLQIDVTTRPTDQRADFTAKMSTNAEPTIDAKNGNTVHSEEYDTPTFPPQAWQIAGNAGPRHIRRVKEIPGLWQ